VWDRPVAFHKGGDAHTERDDGVAQRSPLERRLVPLLAHDGALRDEHWPEEREHNGQRVHIDEHDGGRQSGDRSAGDKNARETVATRACEGGSR